MKKTIEEIKKITEKMSDDFRIHHGKMELSFPDQPDTRAGIKKSKGFMVLLLADYTGNKNEDDLEVAKSTFAYSLAKAMEVDCSPNDFKSL